MEPTPKPHVSHTIAWSLIALFAGSLVFGIWMYSNQIDTIYTGSTTISITHKKTATKPTATTTGTTTTSATADWKTYTNDTYGFSFKYPKDWTVADIASSANTNPGVALASPNTVSNRSQWEAPQNDINITYSSTIAADVTNVLNKLGATTLDEYIAKNKELTKIGNVKVGGIEGVDAIAAGMSAYYNIYLVKDNHLYTIFFVTASSKDKLTDVENTILSTFAFTK